MFGKDIRQPNKRKQIYSCNEGYFNIIDTEHKAYWLGFIAADGCVKIDNRNRYYFTLKLQNRDCNHIQLLLNDLSSNHIIKMSYNKYSYVVISSKILVKQLMSHGIIPRKTKVLQWPVDLPLELDRHFMRGYLDGDGCWSISQPYNIPTLSITSNPNFIYQYVDKVFEHLGINKPKITPICNSASVTYCRLRSTKLLYDFFYNDTTIYLSRKKLKYELAMSLRRN